MASRLLSPVDIGLLHAEVRPCSASAADKVGRRSKMYQRHRLSLDVEVFYEKTKKSWEYLVRPLTDLSFDLSYQTGKF